MAEMVQTDQLEAPKLLGQVSMQTAIDIAGAFPPREVPGPPAMWMGMLHNLASTYPPFGAPACAGQLMPIAQYTPLFALLGTSFGGDGKSTFALPDLRGNIAAGSEIVGEQVAGLLGCYAMVAAVPPSGSSGYPMVGMVAMFGGNYAPQGWMRADGRTLPISEYLPLFQVIGTTFGGDGSSNFCIPNLTTLPGPAEPALAPVGVGQGATTPPVVLGQEVSPFGLGLNYMICLSGLFPSSGGNSGFPMSEPIIGEVVAYAGASIPAGWAVCDGSLLTIDSNQALFSLIGTTYGGDGQTDFALPDLRGSAIQGAPK